MNRFIRQSLVAAALSALSVSTALAQDWQFVDGAGRTVGLDETPERIVAFASSAAALLSFGITPVGIFTDESVADDKTLAEFDISGITVIRTAYNELQPESVLALEPDLIVTEFWPVTGTFSGGDEMTPGGRFEAAAPMVGIAQEGSILGIIERYGQLAEALGADLDAPEIAAQRETFEAARDRLSAAAADKPGLKAMAVWAGPDDLYVAAPGGAAELQDFAAWGLDIVAPDVPDGEYWHALGWENADLYPADVLLLDDRFGNASYEALQAQPLSRLIVAVEAGQVGDWPAWWIRTYGTYAEQLDKLTALVERSEVVTE